MNFLLCLLFSLTISCALCGDNANREGEQVPAQTAASVNGASASKSTNGPGAMMKCVAGVCLLTTLINPASASQINLINDRNSPANSSESYPPYQREWSMPGARMFVPNNETPEDAKDAPFEHHRRGKAVDDQNGHDQIGSDGTAQTKRKLMGPHKHWEQHNDESKAAEFSEKMGHKGMKSPGSNKMPINIGESKGKNQSPKGGTVPIHHSESKGRLIPRMAHNPLQNDQSEIAKLVQKSANDGQAVQPILESKRGRPVQNSGNNPVHNQQESKMARPIPRRGQNPEQNGTPKSKKNVSPKLQ